MEKQLKTLGSLALAMACLTVPLAGGGCEKAQTAAEREMAKALTQSAVMLDSGQTPEAARNLVLQAAADQNISFVSRAVAMGLAGQSHYADAVAGLDELAIKEMQAASLVAQIDGMGWAVVGENLLVEAHLATDPAKTIKAFADNQEHFTQVVTQADATIAKLKQDITAKTAAIKALETQRSAAVAESSTLIDQSEKVVGRQSVELFNKAQVARKQAADFGRDLTQAQRQLAELQRTLGEVEQQKLLAQEAITIAQAQIAKLQAAWTQAQDGAKDRRAAAKALVEGQGIAARAKELAQALANAQALRAPLLQSLDEAIDKYDDAVKASAAFYAHLTDRMNQPGNADSPAKPLWKELQKTQGPETYKLNKATALQCRASVNLNKKRLLEKQLRTLTALQATLKPTNLPLPPELGNLADLQKAIKEATDAAQRDFTTAEQLFTDLVEADKTLPEEKAQAHVGRITSRYSLYRLNGLPADLNTAREQLKELKGTVPEEGPGLAVPPLPTDLEAQIIARKSVAVTPTPPAPAPAVPASATLPPVEAAPAPTPPAPAAPSGGGVLGRLLGRAAEAAKQTAPQPPAGGAPAAPPPQP